MKKLTYYSHITSIALTTVLTLFAMAGLLSCSKGKALGNTDSFADNTIRIALTGSPNTLDPQITSATITSQVNRSIYDTLLFSPDGVAGLAKEWKVSSDGLLWTFVLREGVKFHHGKEFSAEDVQATFFRMQRKDFKSPFVRELENIKEIRASKDSIYKVEMVLSKQDSNMPIIFASSHMAILPADLVYEDHDFATEPVGTGPFKFKKWEQGIKISLEQNKDYFLPLKNIKAVDFYIMPDINTQVQGLQRGEIDVVPYITEPELSTLKKEKGISVGEYPGSTILLLAMNLRKLPFSSLEFRKTIAQSINKQQIIDLAYPGGKLTNAFWQQESPYYPDVEEIYDPAIAKEFFEEYKKTGSTTLTITVPNNFAPHVRAAGLYKAQLEEVGLTVDIKQVDWTTWLSEVYGKGNFDLTVIGHTGKISPYQRLLTFIDQGGYVGWKNEAFNTLMSQLAVEQNPDIQTSIYKQIFTLITVEYPFVFVGQNSVNIAIRNNIKDLNFDPILETYDLRNTSIKK